MFFQNFLKFPTFGLALVPLARPMRRTQKPVPTYRSLLGEAAWLRLDHAIRARFGDDSRKRGFYGLMGTARLSRAGRVLAILARLFGTSLCPKTGSDIVTMINVDGDTASATGIWNRAYLFPAGQRFVVTRVKRFDPRDSLLECLGRGFVMRLDLQAEKHALHFISTGYAWHCGPLPDLLSPGETHVTHRELGGGRFRFTLQIRHPWFGELVFQEGDFFERENVPWKP